MKESERVQPLVEVTLQSLNGLKCSSPNLPKVTAAVAFSGSSEDMQIYSSFVCPRTGHLMVESEVAKPTIATVITDTAPAAAANQNLSCRWSKTQSAPHSAMRLPCQNPRLPPLSLSQSNRDSRVVVSDLPSLDDSEISSDCDGGLFSQISLERNRSQPNSTTDPDAIRPGMSAIWSVEGAALPEIMELNISLRVDPDDLMATTSAGADGENDNGRDRASPVKEIYEVGISHLVLFGGDGGVTFLDLPIKRVQKLPTPLSLHNEAFLRIKVQVFENGIRPPTPSTQNRYPENMMDVHLQQEELMRPILETLQTAEQRMHSQLRSPAAIANADSPVLGEDEEEEDLDIRIQKQTLGCAAFPQLWRRVMELWTACDDGRRNISGYAATGAKNRYHLGGNVAPGTIEANLTFASTIDTSPSFQYFEY